MFFLFSYSDMNFIHCLRLVLNNIVTLLSTSPWHHPLQTAHRTVLCVLHPLCSVQQGRLLTALVFTPGRDWGYKSMQQNQSIAHHAQQGQLAPRWSQLKSSQNTCAWFLLIDSQLHEVPNRHGKNCLEIEPKPTCTQDPQAFRRKPASTVIVQSC